VIVIDASAMVEVLASSGDGGKTLRRRIAAEDRLVAPLHLDAEVTSTVFGLHRAGKLSQPDLSTAMKLLVTIPLARASVTPLWERAHVLYANLSAYDAAYVALAEHLKVPLVTGDAKIHASGVARCPVEVFATTN
jgi:predicted nucleic acid-binding protein